MASIKEIAKLAGTSPSTVSRVLNNPDYKCSDPGLRERIYGAVRSLDYIPNLAARNLKMGIHREAEEAYHINVLMTRTDISQTDPFFKELLRVIETEIHKCACILSRIWYMPLFSDDKRCARENLEQVIGEMHEENTSPVNGLIIIGKCNMQALKLLNKKFKNVVSVNRNSTNYEVDEVLCDGNKVASMAVQYLIDLGHREIGYVGSCHNEARYRGFMATLNKNNIEIAPDYIVETKQTEAEGYKAMEYFLNLEDAPSGIYCANDITAIGMLKCLNRRRKRNYHPSIISSDDIEEAQMMKPLLTTVRLPIEEMGKFALYLLFDRMQGGHQSVVRMELEGRLMVRESCHTVAGYVFKKDGE